ncbi:hypothetical protein KKA14_14085 [bacterium]|nr:hypothetical protein [bacterium]
MQADNDNKDAKISIAYSLKNLYCDDPECDSCLNGKGHGPHWHASFTLRGKQQIVFIGKELKPLDLETYLKQHFPDDINLPQNVNSAINSFPEQLDPDSNLVDHVEIDKIFRKAPKNVSNIIQTPPSERDFKSDLVLLKKTYRRNNLKTVYRNLIKKYHPDRYPGNFQMSAWMAEINGHYQHLIKSAII